MRLQGKSFQLMRPFLKLVSFEISSHKNIKAYMKHKMTGSKFTHWLNDNEKRIFVNSDYFKNSKRKKNSQNKWGLPDSKTIQSYNLDTQTDISLVY